MTGPRQVRELACSAGARIWVYLHNVTGADVAAALECAWKEANAPRSILVDHCTEFTSTVLDALAFVHHITLEFARRDKRSSSRGATGPRVIRASNLSTPALATSA